MASVLHAALLLGTLGAARRLDEACVDDVEWHVQNRPWKDCAQLSRNHALCVKKNEDGTSGYDACPIACLACEGSEDSTTWYSNSKPQNDCAWIAKNADARCGKKDEDTKIDAWYACPSACGGAGDDGHTADTCLADFYDEIQDSLGCGDDDSDDSVWTNWVCDGSDLIFNVYAEDTCESVVREERLSECEYDDESDEYSYWQCDATGVPYYFTACDSSCASCGTWSAAAPSAKTTRKTETGTTAADAASAPPSS